MNITVSLAGTSQPALETQDGIIIPSILSDQTKPWMPFLTQFARIVGDRVLVTSVKDSFSGDSRTGTSHPNGWAIDIMLPDRVSNKVNPHMSDNLSLMLEISRRLRGPIMLAFESDHIHIELTNIMQGVYRYATLRPEFYVNDRVQRGPSYDAQKLWKVTPTAITLLSDDSLINAQRQITNKSLSESEIARLVESVSL